ncbi:MAG: Plug domain-containing protein, partial [Bradyrhizobiaceae bacterium]|nr:Plug domain-containing protein [Bradyrhizobiaceae bacterium]
MPRVCVVVAALLVPWSVWAQSNTPAPATAAPASEPATAPAHLPTINVPVPKQKLKPKHTAERKRAPPKRAAAARTPARAAPTARRATPVAPVVPAVTEATATNAGEAEGADTIGASPVPGSGVPRDKVPSNAAVLPASSFDHTRSAGFLDTVGQFLPGVSIGDQTGNQFQRDVNYRGFTASPVIGTPQGLAVYQNGVRINEVFGDTVNWDFIPESAIGRLELVPNNPVYGLNALGGALSIQMKNGFTWHGIEAE